MADVPNDLRLQPMTYGRRAQRSVKDDATQRRGCATPVEKSRQLRRSRRKLPPQILELNAQVAQFLVIVRRRTYRVRIESGDLHHAQLIELGNFLLAKRREPVKFHARFAIASTCS
jgi:hypothetical protein